MNLTEPDVLRKVRESIGSLNHWVIEPLGHRAIGPLRHRFIESLHHWLIETVRNPALGACRAPRRKVVVFRVALKMGWDGSAGGHFTIRGYTCCFPGLLANAENGPVPGFAFGQFGMLFFRFHGFR